VREERYQHRDVPLKCATLRPVRIEHVVLAVAALALAVLIVLPLASLIWGSVTADGRPTLEHFREALRRRLYVQALWNSLVLGAWTAALSVAIGLPLAWAVSRTNVPARSSSSAWTTTRSRRRRRRSRRRSTRSTSRRGRPRRARPAGGHGMYAPPFTKIVWPVM
jgi:hypothetical protein